MKLKNYEIEANNKGYKFYIYKTSIYDAYAPDAYDPKAYSEEGWKKVLESKDVVEHGLFDTIEEAWTAAHKLNAEKGLGNYAYILTKLEQSDVLTDAELSTIEKALKLQDYAKSLI